MCFVVDACIGDIQGGGSTEREKAAIRLNRLGWNRSVSRGLGLERTCRLKWDIKRKKDRLGRA